MGGFRIVIPARWAATRLPGKPLRDLAGRPLLAHVHARAVAAGADEVLVATDDERIVAACRAYRVDEAAITGVIADRPDRRGVAHRDVDRTLQMAANVVAVDEIEVGLDAALHHPDLGLVGDVADRPADRTRPEQGALWPAQRFDAVEVIQVDVGGEQ